MGHYSSVHPSSTSSPSAGRYRLSNTTDNSTHFQTTINLTGAGTSNLSVNGESNSIMSSPSTFTITSGYRLVPGPPSFSSGSFMMQTTNYNEGVVQLSCNVFDIYNNEDDIFMTPRKVHRLNPASPKRSQVLDSLSHSVYKKKFEEIRKKAVRYVSNSILELMGIPTNHASRADVLTIIMLAMGHSKFKVDLTDADSPFCSVYNEKKERMALRITRIEEHPLILLGSSSLESNSTRSRKVKNQSLNSAPKSNCKGKSISQTSFPNSNVGMTYQTGRSASPHPRLYEVLSTEMQDTPNDLQKESDIPPIVTAQFYEDVESPSKMVLEAVEIFKILLNCETVLHEILSDSEDSVSSLPGNAPESNVRDALVDIPKADTEGISEDWQSFNDSFGIEQVSGNFALPRDASGLTHDDDDTLLAAPHHDDEEVHFIEGSNVSNVDESLCNESLKTPSPSVISIDLKSTLENPGGIFDDLLDDHIVVSRAIDKPLCQESFKQPTPSFFCLETTTEMSDESCCKEYTKSSTPTTQEDSSSTEFARAALPDAFCKSPSKDAVLERTLRAIDSLKSKYTPPSTLANRRWSSNSCSYTQPTSPTSNRTITMKPVLSHSRKTSTSSAGHKPEEAAIKILPPHLRALSGSSLSTPAEGLISPRFPPHVRAIMAANSQTADFEDAGATLQFPPHTRTPHLIPAVTNMTAETFPTPFIHLREDRLENQNHFETEDLPNITVPPKAGPVSSPLSKVNSNKLDTEPPEPCLAVYADMEEDAETIVDNAKYLITHDSSSCSLVGFFNACSLGLGDLESTAFWDLRAAEEVGKEAVAALMDGDRKRAERLRVEEERLRCSSQEARMAMVGLGLMCRGILV